MGFRDFKLWQSDLNNRKQAKKAKCLEDGS